MRHDGLAYLLARTSATRQDYVREVAIKLLRIYHRDRWRISPRKLGASVDDVVLDRPIFLLGVPGNGSTLIGRCLRRNRHVVSASGNSTFWTGTDEMGLIRNRMERLPRTFRANRYRVDIEHPIFDSTELFACDSLLPLFRGTASDANDDDSARLRRVLREHIAVYAHDASDARFIDKTHANTVKIPLLASALRHAKPRFVLIVRSPYTTCPWTLDRKPPALRVELARQEQLRLVAEHWANAHRIVLEDSREVDGIAAVRFEDFLADPARTVQALSAFLGLEFDTTMLPRPGDRRPFATLPSDRKWFPLYPDARKPPSPEDAAIIAEQCSPIAARFGYHAEGHTARTSPIEMLSGASRLS
jgi:Sulfotransferase family